MVISKTSSTLFKKYFFQAMFLTMILMSWLWTQPKSRLQISIDGFEVGQRACEVASLLTSIPDFSVPENTRIKSCHDPFRIFLVEGQVRSVSGENLFINGKKISTKELARYFGNPEHTENRWQSYDNNGETIVLDKTSLCFHIFSDKMTETSQSFFVDLF